MFLDDDVRFAGDALLDTPDPVQSDAFGTTFADADSYLQESGSTGPETASVTMSPLGGGKVRIFEKNDGDPTFYEAMDVNHPHKNRKAVRKDGIRFADGSGLAYPRANNAAVQLQAAAGRYTRDGNHLADASEGGGTAYDRPVAIMSDGGLTQSPNDVNHITNSLEYALKDSEWRDALVDDVTNSYELDINDPEHARKLKELYGSTVK